MSSQKLGFWGVFALVTGSQIGTGVFMLPASLAPFGVFSIYGWVISSVGAIILALLFAILCARFPRTGGPHVYVQKAFGSSIAFFTGWTYWVISWVSTSAVIISAIGYLSPFFDNQTATFYLFLEILLLFTIVILNLKGIAVAGKVEFLLTLLKFIPLLVVAITSLYWFDINNFSIAQSITEELTIPQTLGKVTLLTFWGFIGVESATTPAGSVINPTKTIPRAIVFGTICVSILYLVNSIGIMGMTPGTELMNSKAPYVDASQIIFGGQWHLLISLIASIICIGTLNAWVLTSGQIALGLAEDGLMPRIFARKNKNEAPFFGLIISVLGILPLLIITLDDNLSRQITSIIDFSVIAFLLIYLLCSISFLKLLLQEPKNSQYYHWIIGFLSVIFCSWIIYETPIRTLLIASMFTLSGVPVYFFGYKVSKNK